MSQSEPVCTTHVIDEQKVKKIRKVMPKKPLADKVVQIFKTLGSPTRFNILFALMQAELCVCDLAHILNRSITATSHQLRILRDQELIKSRREGNVIYYSLMCEHVPHLIDTGIIHIKKEKRRST